MGRLLRTWFQRLGVALGLTIIGTAATLVAVSGPASAAGTCSSGYYCFFSSTSFNGSKVSIYYYTSGWTTLPALVNDTESAWDNQYDDGCFGNPHPYMYARAVFSGGTYWYSLVGTYNGLVWTTLNPHYVTFSYGGGGYYNFNNMIDQYWNACDR